MSFRANPTSNYARVQRAGNGMLLGAAIALSADDIAFVDSSVETLEIHKKQIDDGLILEIRGVKP